MSTLALIGLGALVAYSLLCVLYVSEDRRGERLILARTRDGLDSAIVRLGSYLAHLPRRLFGKVVQSTFHYGSHQLLQNLLQWVYRVEKRLDTLVRKNRAAAAALRDKQSANHLDAIAAHKKAAALDEEKRQELLKH